MIQGHALRDVWNAETGLNTGDRTRNSAATRARTDGTTARPGEAVPQG